MMVLRSSSFSFPKGLPLGGSGAPAAADGVVESFLAPQVTKNSPEKWYKELKQEDHDGPITLT